MSEFESLGPEEGKDAVERLEAEVERLSNLLLLANLRIQRLELELKGAPAPPGSQPQASYPKARPGTQWW